MSLNVWDSSIENFGDILAKDVELVSVSSFSNNDEVRCSDISRENYPHSPPCFLMCMYVYTCIAAKAYTAVDLAHESQRLGLFQ